MMRMDTIFDLIAFDADDTLWHNEPLYTSTQDKFKELLSHYRDIASTEDQLYQTEMRNLEYYGYGIKSFTLSMIETAIEITAGEIRGSDIQKIIDFARAMLRAETMLLDHVPETIAKLSKRYELMIITKGDLFDQESKLARSGLAEYFHHFETVSEKNLETYATLLARHHLDPSRFLMVGNSVKSDILPVIALGAKAVYIPYQLTWAHEIVPDHDLKEKGYLEIEHIGMLPGLLDRLEQEE